MNYDMTLFIPCLNQFITENKIPFPSSSISYEEMKHDFEKLCNLNTNHLIVMMEWKHRCDYEVPLTFLNKGEPLPILIKESRAGNICSRYFSFHERLCVAGKSLTDQTTIQTWQDPKRRLSALRFFKLSQKSKQNLTPQRFTRMFMNQTCSANSFRPSVAKCLFDCMEPKKVLDFSMGWGDRLLGALSSKTVELYVGTDPNLANQSIYQKILQLNNSRERSKDSSRKSVLLTDLYTLPAEEWHIHKKYPQVFDLVFTSCPYFNTERYAAGQTHETLQSWYRYRTMESWLQGFLFPTLTSCYHALQKNGILILNLADCNHLELCFHMRKFLEYQLLMEYIGVIGYRMQKRYGIGIRNQSMAYAEPMWVFKKV